MVATAKIIGWGRPDYKVPPSWCAITDPDHGGSVITACDGRWPVSDSWSFLLERDRDADASGTKLVKCGACDVIAREQRTLEGLAELKHAPLIETRPFPEFAGGIDAAYPVGSLDAGDIVDFAAAADEKYRRIGALAIEINVVDKSGPLLAMQLRLERMEFDVSDIETYDLGGEQ